MAQHYAHNPTPQRLVWISLASEMRVFDAVKSILSDSFTSCDRGDDGNNRIFRNCENILSSPLYWIADTVLGFSQNGLGAAHATESKSLLRLCFNRERIPRVHWQHCGKRVSNTICQPKPQYTWNPAFRGLSEVSVIARYEFLQRVEDQILQVGFAKLRLRPQILHFPSTEPSPPTNAQPTDEWLSSEARLPFNVTYSCPPDSEIMRTENVLIYYEGSSPTLVALQKDLRRWSSGPATAFTWTVKFLASSSK
ncbi:hypothetical protein R3P38DRAFT_3341472 [Favolaschia claudopus]|uniref:Uncharacterized protein n=1 Tax=Favolaschia claudopus TaxID=2862362 RepID=A0AAW0E9A8_9AGAR